MKKTAKWIASLMAACVIALVCAGCKNATIEVEQVTLEESLKLGVGETKRLTATVRPFDADDSTVTWSSSNNDVASVSKEGMVTAVSVGTAKIIAKAGGISAECEVIVHVHSYSNGKCTVCESNPSMANCEIDSDGKLVSYSGSETEVVIPHGVTGIGDRAFYGRSSLKSVTIPDSVTSIGSSAFDGCSSLESVVIPDSVTDIGSSAFHGCSRLGKVAIPDSVTDIGYSAFSWCSRLESVKIGSGVKSVGSKVFSNCGNLESVTIIDGMKSIGNQMFYGCTSLESVSIPDSVKSVESEAFSGCTSLESMTIPDGVKSVGSEAFSKCSSLKNVTIGNGVTSVGYKAFSKCDALTKVTYTGTIADWCGISWSHLLLTDYYYVIDDYSANPLSSGKAMLYIDDKAVTEVDIPDDVAEIKDFAFFNYDNLKSVTIGNNVKTVGIEAFMTCDSLESVTIGNGVKEIGKRAFSSCSKLKTITYDGTKKEWNNISGINDSGLYYKTITGSDGNTWYSGI